MKQVFWLFGSTAAWCLLGHAHDGCEPLVSKIFAAHSPANSDNEPVAGQQLLLSHLKTQISSTSKPPHVVGHKILNPFGPVNQSWLRASVISQSIAERVKNTSGLQPSDTKIQSLQQDLLRHLEVIAASLKIPYQKQAHALEIRLSSLARFSEYASFSNLPDHFVLRWYVVDPNASAAKMISAYSRTSAHASVEKHFGKEPMYFVNIPATNVVNNVGVLRYGLVDASDLQHELIHLLLRSSNRSRLPSVTWRFSRDNSVLNSLFSELQIENPYSSGAAFDEALAYFGSLVWDQELILEELVKMKTSGSAREASKKMLSMIDRGKPNETAKTIAFDLAASISELRSSIGEVLDSATFPVGLAPTRTEKRPGEVHWSFSLSSTRSVKVAYVSGSPPEIDPSINVRVQDLGELGGNASVTIQNPDIKLVSEKASILDFLRTIQMGLGENDKVIQQVIAKLESHQRREENLIELAAAESITSTDLVAEFTRHLNRSREDLKFLIDLHVQP